MGTKHREGAQEEANININNSERTVDDQVTGI